jgi:uncharacterized protein
MATTSTVQRFVWHELLTTDVEHAKAFYHDLLGVEYEVYKPGEFDYPMISARGQTHGGIAKAPEGVPSHWLGHVHVDDVDAAAARAAAGGGRVLREPMDMAEIGRFALIADPDGPTLSLYRPPHEAPAAEGVFVWDELLTENVDAARRFYGDVIGWSATEMDMGDGHVYTLFQVGDAQVAGAMQRPEMAPRPGWVIYAGTEDVDRSAARASELGANVLQTPFDLPGGIGRIAIIADPTGATIGLFQPGPRQD